VATRDLLTLEEARRAVNLPSPATVNAQDTTLQLFVTGLSGRVDKLCGPVVQRTVTGERHNGGQSKVLLTLQHVATVTSVVEWAGTSSTTLTEETDSTKPATGFLLDPGEGGIYAWVRRRSGNADAAFPVGRRNVVTTYSAGRYASTATVDETFKLAATAVLRRLYKREQSSWAQSPSYFEDTDNPTASVGFYKAVDPMIKELLCDELLPPVGL
jgi:hypothetical protein